jgi:chromatin structure-remodeling complex subunit RSC9
VAEEVDWALPRLVTASYDLADRFDVSVWLDAAPAFMEWPERWLEDLRRAAALKQAPKDGPSLARAAVPQWSTDPATERRATESLLIMRNASCNFKNAKHMARPQLCNYLLAFFALPLDFTLQTLMQNAEPVLQIFVILQSVLSYMTRGPELDALFLETLPAIVRDTRDAAVLELVIPLIISYLAYVGKNHPLNIPVDLSIHLLHLLTLIPPTPIYEYALDLLVSLTIHSTPSLGILNDSGIAAHLKTVARVLQHGVQVRTVEQAVPAWTMGSVVPNPASTVTQVEEASKRRAKIRAEVQKHINEHGQIPVSPELGTRPPQIDEHLRRKLMLMKEPERSIAWSVLCSYTVLSPVSTRAHHIGCTSHSSTLTRAKYRKSTFGTPTANSSITPTV